jgi:zinc/manganese transport system substrate-binding protein
MFAATLAVAGVACGSDDAGSDDAVAATDSPTDVPAIEAIDVVVTTSILGDIVSSALGDLAGSAVNVEVIMPLGADAHDFAPSARQAETMENADLLVVNGLGLEEGLSGVVESVEGDGTRVFTFTDHIELIEFEGGDDHSDEEGDEHADEEGEDHSDDPHFWMDPTRVIAAVEAFADELIDVGLDPARVETNINAYVAELERLDAEVEGILDAVPADRRVLVTNHEAFGYFAERYGFEIAGTIIPSLTTSAEPSAAALEDLAALIVAEGVPAIFAETTDSDRLTQAVANEVGGDVEVVELFTESLGDDGSGAETYAALMTVNAQRIAAALS